jgi:hypothetical protein
MCDHEAVEWLKEKFGGGVSVYASRLENQRAIARWRCSGYDAGRFLSMVLPFLRVKTKQSELAIALAHLKPGPLRADICGEIRDLNKRGT